MEENQALVTPKWEGKVMAKLESTKADQIWSLYKDFFNLNKWLQAITTCYGLHGSNGEPGCIRYCAGPSFEAVLTGKPTTSAEMCWAKERLVDVNEEDMILSYEIVESNIGLSGYESTVKISPMEGDSCVVEWLFTGDPVNGWKFEDMVGSYEVCLQNTLRAMETDIRTPSD